MNELEVRGRKSLSDRAPVEVCGANPLEADYRL